MDFKEHRALKLLLDILHNMQKIASFIWFHESPMMSLLFL